MKEVGGSGSTGVLAEILGPVDRVILMIVPVHGGSNDGGYPYRACVAIPSAPSEAGQRLDNHIY